jgi:hypothetical protein
MSLDFNTQSSNRIPVDTARVGERDLLVAVCQLLTEMNMELAHIRNALGQSATSRSSVELAQTSKGVNLTVKSYEGSDIEAPIQDAIAGFATAYREVKRQMLADWEDTAAMVANVERP